MKYQQQVGGLLEGILSQEQMVHYSVQFDQAVG